MLCPPGRRAVAQSHFTAALTSWAQAIFHLNLPSSWDYRCLPTHLANFLKDSCFFFMRQFPSCHPGWTVAARSRLLQPLPPRFKRFSCLSLPSSWVFYLFVCLFILFCFETESHSVSQTHCSLHLLGSSDSHASAS